MRIPTPLLTVVVVPLLAVAHGGENLQARHYARQASSAASSHSGSTSPSSSSGTVPSSVAVTSNTIVTSAPSTTSSSTSNFTITLLSTNPTAVPLASIVSNEPSGTTQPLTTTEVPGAVPSGIPNAPPLPNSTFHMLRYYFFPRTVASIS